MVDSPRKFTDTEMLDWLHEQAENGCLSSCFDLDGGVHVTLESVDGKVYAARNCNTFRDGVNELMNKGASNA